MNQPIILRISTGQDRLFLNDFSEDRGSVSVEADCSFSVDFVVPAEDDGCEEDAGESVDAPFEEFSPDLFAAAQLSCTSPLEPVWMPFSFAIGVLTMFKEDFAVFGTLTVYATVTVFPASTGIRTVT